MDVMRSRNLTPRRQDAKGNREKKKAGGRASRSAVYALIGASLISFLYVMVPAISWLAHFSWFIGLLAGALFYRRLTLGVKSAARLLP
jgi:Flp pilus assembly protein TadB